MVERLSFSISLIEQDPEVVPDVDIAAQVGKEFFLSLMNRGMNRAKGT
jgi:tRNA A37 methylthiotransferase MiaB